MPLAAGHKLGPYEILAPIGAGGMGEVYKARDTRLERTVAVKVSAERFSERFQREAQAIAALNHPHICTLHDVGPDYLVMELIEGTELSGPQPISEALRLAIQIADALSHAHRQGVIHRDLKPANIMVTKSGIKVLDFGLAKLSRGDAPSSQPQVSLAATMTHALTQEGTLIGTPQYMAPEQLEGQEADRRSDIFAFGVVLYQMITGHPAFEGKSQANLIAAILAAEPQPITQFQPLIPPALDHLIKTCLAKDPDDRRQNMHDVLLELKWIAEGGSQAGIPKPVVARRKRREYLSWALAGLASVAALAIGFLHFREKPAETSLVRFEFPAPPKTIFQPIDLFAVSPDGRQVAFTGAPPGEKRMLWVRRLDSLQTTMLAGTEGAFSPFWSPDSRFIGYFTDQQLMKIPSTGGPGQVVCATPAGLGGTWNRDSVILFASRSGLAQVSAAGGEQKLLLKLDEARKERFQAWPHFLPDGRHFLYSSNSTDPGKSGIFAASLAGGEPRLLISGESNALFVSPGYLLFTRASTLLAQPFDPARLQVSGEPFPVAESVGRMAFANASHFSASPNGVLVYRTEASTSLQLAWYAPGGKRLGPAGEPRRYIQFTMAPDERRIAAQIIDQNVGTSDIWVLDLASGIFSRQTSNSATEDSPKWSPDGREILFSSNRNPPQNLYRKAVGGGEEQLILKSSEANYPEAWLKDGSFLFINVNGKAFFRLMPGADARPETLLTTSYSKDGPRLSPDGRWIAYSSDESGRWEVYVASFPAFTERRPVSGNGGLQPHWRGDGRELYYLALDGNLMSVSVKPGSPPETGIPQVLFQTRIPIRPTSDQFAVTKDGQRVLLLESLDIETKPFTVTLNWPAAVKK